MISELTVDACERVAELHIQNLRTRYVGYVGQRMLLLYYSNIVDSVGGKCFVADIDGSIEGFVCGIWDQDAVRAGLRKRMWPSLSFWGAAQLIVKPKSIIRIVRDYLRFEPLALWMKGGYELRPIVVSAKARGTGLATMLLDNLMVHAGSIGYDNVFLYCEVDNWRAKAFYQKTGFIEMSRVLRGGINYSIFERRIETHQPPLVHTGQ